MRSRVLSTRKIKLYQAVNLVLWIVLLILIITGATRTSGLFEAFAWPIYWLLGFYFIFLKRTLKLRNIEYDDQNIYIEQQGQEVIIPFLEVKDIKLQSVTGVHTVFLYREIVPNKEIWFKSSLWYPFNFKKVDDEVYKLLRKIERAKAQIQDTSITGLPSNTS